jgi:hypothetical protein
MITLNNKGTSLTEIMDHLDNDYNAFNIENNKLVINSTNTKTFISTMFSMYLENIGINSFEKYDENKVYKNDKVKSIMKYLSENPLFNKNLSYKDLAIKIASFKSIATDIYSGFDYKSDEGIITNLIEEIVLSDYGRFEVKNNILDIVEKSFVKGDSTVTKSFAKITNGKYITIAETNLTYHDKLSSREPGDKVSPIYNFDMVHFLSKMKTFIPEGDIELALTNFDGLIKSTDKLKDGLTIYPKAVISAGTKDELMTKDFGFVKTDKNSVITDDMETKLDVDIKSIDTPRIIFSFDKIRQLIGLGTKATEITVVENNDNTRKDEIDDEDIFEEEGVIQSDDNVTSENKEIKIDENKSKIQLEDKSKIGRINIKGNVIEGDLNPDEVLLSIKSRSSVYKEVNTSPDNTIPLDKIIHQTLAELNTVKDFEKVNFNDIFEVNKNILLESFDNTDEYKDFMRDLVEDNC